MQDYEEKRSYPRMAIECPASFKIVNGEGGGGGAIVKNLSGGGLLMWLEKECPKNAEMKIEIKPVNDITPPMVAEVKVIRCEPTAGEEGSFAVACQIKRLLG